VHHGAHADSPHTIQKRKLHLAG